MTTANIKIEWNAETLEVIRELTEQIKALRGELAAKQPEIHYHFSNPSEIQPHIPYYLPQVIC
jgi:hypothetical protein